MRICIVSSKHVSYNPRVVKEADALSAAGHAVTVVTVCNNVEQGNLDQEVLRTRHWRLRTVNYRRLGLREGFLWLLTGVRQRLFRSLSAVTCRFGVAERVQGREYAELKRLACSVPADLYIAHHVEALGPASAAALKHDARLAFDAEDFHSGMYVTPTGTASEGSLEQSVAALLASAASHPKTRVQRCVEYLEQKYLPRCDSVTAAADGIAVSYALKYQLPRPTTVLNVFPLEELDVRACATDSEQAPIKLYWYSQVIGPGRGLESAVRALPLITRPCELHVRGTPQADFVTGLRALADELGVSGRLFFHPPCSPNDLVAEAARYDIGLALEHAIELNRLICLTNKIFTYMNAGLAVVATDTPAQRQIMAEVPDAGILCRMNDAGSLALAIDRLIAAPDPLMAAKVAARRAAVTRFNWEAEAEKLVVLAESGAGRPTQGDR